MMFSYRTSLTRLSVASLLWFLGYRLATLLFSWSLFLFILRLFFLGVVECYEFTDCLYVIDRQLSATRYQCWLVHEDQISYHLGLPDTKIEQTVASAMPVNSSQA
jgi:hypothetical protein